VSASAELVQRQLDAYNTQNIDAFLACYAEDAVLAGLNGEITHRGLAAIRKRHEELFYEFPKNHAKLANRIDLGTTVIDHEQVERSPGGDRFEVAAIYTLKGGKIVRVDFARAGAV
jgi:hypothetical protein